MHEGRRSPDVPSWLGFKPPLAFPAVSKESVQNQTLLVITDQRSQSGSEGRTPEIS
jgi:hypothetical protein